MEIGHGFNPGIVTVPALFCSLTYSAVSLNIGMGICISRQI